MNFLLSIHWKTIWKLYVWLMERGLLGLTVSDYWRLEVKPPVTTALIVFNVLVHLRPRFLHGVLPTLDQASFNPNLIIEHKDLKRFFLPAFYHIGETHLVCNMLSLLWMGIKLENQMGSVQYAFMVVVLLCMSRGIQLLLAIILLFFNYDRAYYFNFSAGFSGVLFGMQVILNSHSSYTYIYGITVPSCYVAWVELFETQMLFPRASFLGHLGGLLAGTVYSYTKYYSAPNPASVSIHFVLGGVLVVLLYSHPRSYYAPVVKVIRCLCSTLSLLLRYVVGMVQPPGNRFVDRGIFGMRQTTSSSVVWRCRVCTFDNLHLVSVCEMCGTERGGNDEMV